MKHWRFQRGVDLTSTCCTALTVANHRRDAEVALLPIELPRCRGAKFIFETNGLKAPYFQGVESKRFQHGSQADVNLYRALPRELVHVLQTSSSLVSPVR